MTRSARGDHVKRNGVHYTPSELARFLAESAVAAADLKRGATRVLDPACGDGGLLVAVFHTVAPALRKHLVLEGYDTDGAALAAARRSLDAAGARHVVLHHRDFLSEFDDVRHECRVPVGRALCPPVNDAFSPGLTSFGTSVSPGDDGRRECLARAECPSYGCRVPVGRALCPRANDAFSPGLTSFGTSVSPGDDGRRECLARAECPSNGCHAPGEYDAAAFERFDLAIANPPYVRTQVLGADRAQALSRRFGLTGRVDLSHAFAMGMAAALKPGGTLGLLTSNRFLTIRSGAALRAMFESRFDLDAIYDLGDTKLFAAAVLPAVLVARKGRTATGGRRNFLRIDAIREEVARGVVKRRARRVVAPPEPEVAEERGSLWEALRDDAARAVVRTPEGAFAIERGTIAVDDAVWSLANPETDEWLAAVGRHQAATFGELATIRVGIKTTADAVFVRDDWDSLPVDERPEPTLLRPLLTHREAERWRAAAPRKQVLYPHESVGGRRRAVDLARYPRAARYFAKHRDRLARRRYLVDGGRAWHEIWVPHDPDGWARPKIVWPDIAERPRFFHDAAGAVVQGDCYWATLNDGVDFEWLLLMLGVGNSSFVTRYYDAVFHNKLYAGRRRFMTQYVARFPLPALDAPASRKIVRAVSRAIRPNASTAALERDLDRLVEEAFGVRGM